MILVLAILLLTVQATIQQDCIVDTSEFIISGFDATEPLLLNPETLDYIYPEAANGEARYISVPEGTSILVSCGASSFVNNTYPGSEDGQTFVANCRRNTENLFETNGTLFKMEGVACYGVELDTVTVVEDQLCAEDKGTIIQVGFPISSNNQIVPLYEVCFDLEAKIMFYVKYTIIKNQRYRRAFKNRIYPDSDDRDFYNLQTPVEVSYIYAKRTINALLGLPEDSDKYFPSNLDEGTDSNQIDIIQETLADYVHFFYYSQEVAAVRLFNSVPLWDIYEYSDLSNWVNIKFSLDYVADDKNTDLLLYSGTYGVATLPHEETGEDVELYLYEDVNRRAIPLPKLLWHVVYHTEQKKAIVLVAVNNPFVIKEDDVVCEDVSLEYGWDDALLWQRDRDDLGHVYSCTYDDFKRVVSFLPDLEVDGVLSGGAE